MAAAARRSLSLLRGIRSFALHSHPRSPCPVHFPGSTRDEHQRVLKFGAFFTGKVLIFLGLSGNIVFAEDGSGGEPASKDEQVEAQLSGLQKIEDGSVVSNEHTIKWRIFTDNGRDLFSKGKLGDAEKYFQAALNEAKEGFGIRDPHVASSCNNLAELYRIRKEFNKAEPLYLEAINILEESFGSDDIRVGAALHNLGQFYHVQRKFVEAKKSYERALKIEGRVLGKGHPDYANTMYHLGKVLIFLGKEKEGEALIEESIRILEQIGLGESSICIHRMSYLSQNMLKSGRLNDAQSLQRRILHCLELSSGWDSLETIMAAEALALTLESLGKLKDSQDLLERSLASRKKVLSDNHVQVASNSLHLARLSLLDVKRLCKTNYDWAKEEFNKAVRLIDDSFRITKGALNSARNNGALQSRSMERDLQAALLVFFRSLDAVGLLETTKGELVLSGEYLSDAEKALRLCVSFLKEPQIRSILGRSAPLREEGAASLRRLQNLMKDNPGAESTRKVDELQTLIAEAQRILGEIPRDRRK